MKVLIISCHTDDIELSAGATVSGLDNVYGYVPTYYHDYGEGFETWGECDESWNRLGIKKVTGVMDTHHARQIDRQILLDDLIKLRTDLKPTLVITHGSYDTHQSHEIVYKESLRAFTNCCVLGYNHPWNCKKGTDDRLYIKNTQHQVDLKLSSLSCYKSQMNKWYFNKDWNYYRMKSNGYEINVTYAEKFEVIRWIQ